MSWQSFPGSFLAVSFWQSCYARPVCPVLSVCPVLPATLCLSRAGCPLLALPSFLSCTYFLILMVLSWQPCPGNPVLAVLSWHPCPGSPFLAVLPWWSCSANPAFLALYRPKRARKRPFFCRFSLFRTAVKVYMTSRNLSTTIPWPALPPPVVGTPSSSGAACTVSSSF
jgi:hypothetical protein